MKRTLRSLDLPLTTAKRWQEETRIPEERFEAFIEAVTSAGEELTTAALLRSTRSPFVPVVTIRDDRIMTPLPLAKAIAGALRPSGTILDPCAGDGVFVKALRPYGRVRWCEIDRGRDFFTWTTPVDWIITNPPWGQFRAFLERSLSLADHVVFLVTVNHWWTRRRVAAVRQGGFGYRDLLLVDQPAGFEATGFQLGAMHLQKGYRGRLRIAHL